MAKAVKTAAAKAKPAAEKNEIGIKYTDKSPGQPELVPIFEGIVKLLKPWEKGNLKLRGGKGGQAALISDKKVIIEGRERTEMWFAAVLVQKGYVGFYFTPVSDPRLRPLLHPDLLRSLKGRGCFHIKKFDKEVSAQIADALKVGHANMKQKGWI